MEQSKKEFLPLLQGVKLSKTQSPTTAENRERMKVIPYALAIGSIKYAMFYTRHIVYLIKSLSRGAIVIQEWVTRQRSKNILSGIRKCFSIMEVTKSSS